MDVSVKFSFEELDGLSEIPLMHLSYLIQTLLPVRLIGWNNVKRHYESVLASTRDLDSEDSDDSFIVTGSIAEGYAIPNALLRTDPPTVEKTADVDVLWVQGNLKVSTTPLKEPLDSEFKGYFEEEGLQPGYTRICLPSMKQRDETFIYDEERGKYYFSSTVLLEKVYSTHHQWPLSDSAEASLQGPALTVVDSRVITNQNMYEANIGSSTDTVIAVFCKPWPEVASSWQARVSKSEWLEQHLVESIIGDCCHVVPVPSKIATKPELVWRISFSASEGRLAREAVTDHQRQCYIYLKILRHQIMKNTGIVLSSYVFKSVFLYCCEKIPLHYWEDYPGNCVLYMLDVLLECLERKHVPTYFVPENNLVAHLSQSELDAAVAVVVSLRVDPVSPILDYTDSRILGYHSVIAPFREMVKPLLDDMQMFKEHRNKETSLMEGIVATGYSICHYLLHEQASNKEAELAKHQEAIKCLIDIFTFWLSRMGLNASLAQFINSAGLAVKDLKISCRFFAAVASLSADYPEFLAVRGNLACMYHSLAYTYPESSEERMELLNKAGQMFKQIYDENKSSTIDYATYLVKRKRYEEARRILEDFFTNIDTHAPSTVQYGMNEQETLDDPLLQHVKRNGKIVADDISFAYFYLAKCLSVLKNTDQDCIQFKTVIERFETHCKNLKTENAKILWQYAIFFSGI